MPQLYRVIVNYSFQTELVNNVYWLKALNDADGSKALDVATEVKTRCEGILKFIYSTDLLFTSVMAQCVSVPNGSSIQLGFTPGSKGNLAGAVHAPFVCCQWTLHSERGGPSGTGKLYHAGVVLTDATSGVLSSTGFNRQQTAVNGLLGQWGTGGPSLGYRWGVFSKKLGGHFQPYPMSAWSQITSVFIQQKLTHMNTRRAGVGQ
jgi:hypothetical protein